MRTAERAAAAPAPPPPPEPPPMPSTAATARNVAEPEHTVTHDGYSPTARALIEAAKKSVARSRNVGPDTIARHQTPRKDT